MSLRVRVCVVSSCNKLAFVSSCLPRVLGMCRGVSGDGSKKNGGKEKESKKIK